MKEDEYRTNIGMAHERVRSAMGLLRGPALILRDSHMIQDLVDLRRAVSGDLKRAHAEIQRAMVLVEGKTDGPSLDDLLASAKGHTPTPEELKAQRRSFVYGNTRLGNDAITREHVDRAIEALTDRARESELRASLRQAREAISAVLVAGERARRGDSLTNAEDVGIEFQLRCALAACARHERPDDAPAARGAGGSP